MQITDLSGLGQPLAKLIKAIHAATGVLYEPTRIRRRDAAKANGIRLLSEAQADSVRALTQADKDRAIILADAQQEILDRASERIVHRELRRQRNIDAIVGESVAALPEQVSDQPVDEDWLTRFFNIAQDISDVRMQELWGRILAGEVAKPGSFSLRSLECLRQISKDEAELFAKARNCALKLRAEFILPAHQLSSEGSSDDIKWSGLSYGDILRLDNAGLLESQRLSLKMESEKFGEEWVAIVSYGDIDLCFAHASLQMFEFLGFVFTPVGCELASLVTINPNMEYLKIRLEGYRKQGYKVLRAHLIDTDASGIRYNLQELTFA